MPLAIYAGPRPSRVPNCLHKAMASGAIISWRLLDDSLDSIPVVKLIDQGVRSSIDLGSGQYKGTIV